MKIHSLLIAGLSAMAVAACTDDSTVSNTVTPTPGVEVQFNTYLVPNPSRTIYGEETDNAFPIKWLEGDQLYIMSPACDPDSATYKISFDGQTPETVNGFQAVSGGVLIKQNEIGVRWTDATSGSFFSIYPAGSVNGHTTATRTISCRLKHFQADKITATKAPYTALADMDAGFLYAATYGATPDRAVSLYYHPLSTAIRFTLTGPSSGTAIVSKVTLKAPEGTAIAGNFDVTFDASSDQYPTITPEAVNTATGSAYNYVEIQAEMPGGFLTLGTGETCELNAFIIPQSGLSITSEWSITVYLSDGRVLTKNLGGTTSAGQSTELKPGQIHTLPALPAIPPATAAAYDPSNWLVNIPANTYLSEISLPGSWNSLNSSFQGTNPSISAQYSAGCRAFHLDTRWITTASANMYNSTGKFGGLGVAVGGTNSTLTVYSGSVFWNQGNELGKMMRSSATGTFASYLSQITNSVADDEYMVVFCTFANNSFQDDSHIWYRAVSEACASNDKVIDASILTQNTVVGQVQGKVIVVCCLEDSESNPMPNIAGSKCLFANLPMTLSQKDMDASLGATNFIDTLYKPGTSAVQTTGLGLLATQAQVTSNTTSAIQTNNRGYAPTLDQRKAIVTKFMNWSQQNFGESDYAHNYWIYCGIGGYLVTNAAADEESEPQKGISSVMNPWFKSQFLDNMSATGIPTPYYPVGIVLMNYVNDYTGVVDDILQLNNKYYKAYDPSKSADRSAYADGGDGTLSGSNPVAPTPSTIVSASPAHSSGFTRTDDWQVF